MMEAKKKYEKPAFRLVTDLGSILECLYEVYGTDGTMLIAGNKLSDTVIYPFIRMIKKKCKAVDAEKLNLMLWKIYMVSSRKKELPWPAAGVYIWSVYRRNVFDLRLSADDFSAHMYYCRVLPRQ